MARKNNFSEAELSVLVEEVEARKSVLFGSHGDGSSKKIERVGRGHCYVHVQLKLRRMAMLTPKLSPSGFFRNTSLSVKGKIRHF